jgi:hypothetical protein
MDWKCGSSYRVPEFRPQSHHLKKKKEEEEEERKKKVNIVSDFFQGSSGHENLPILL